MQYVTTAILTFLVVFEVILSVFFLYSFYILRDQLYEAKKNLLKAIADDTERVYSLTRKVESLSTSIDRHATNLREFLEPIKSTKPNNWDSMRKVFRGPMRSESNVSD